MQTLEALIRSYDADVPLERASTIPSGWYVDSRVAELERRSVFARAWHVAARAVQLAEPGQYVTEQLPGGDPVLLVRDTGRVRGFFNVCRHHAAAVATAAEGTATVFRCPYHGWTYGLDGQLKGTPDFAGVCDFDRGAHGLVPIETAGAGPWVWVRPHPEGEPLERFLGTDLVARLEQHQLGRLHWQERRRYVVPCNWKVFVDNYLDGGYHVPHLHKGLDSVLDYGAYAIETGPRFCLQSSPIVARAADAQTAAVRAGDRASYYWVYPNFMINVYGDTMDTNLVLPRGIDRTEVIFDFYFHDVSDRALAHNLASIEVSERIQQEDVAICASVQRGLGSRAYTAGRLSVRREAGVHLFHRLLHDDLLAGLALAR